MSFVDAITSKNKLDQESLTNQLIKDKNSAIRQFADEQMVDSLKAQLRVPNSKLKVSIHFLMNDNAEESRLQRVWPEFDITFTSSVLVGHPFAAASRILETIECKLDLLGKNPSAVEKKYIEEASLRDVLLLECGGNAKNDLLTSDFIHYHSCEPNTGPYDQTRKTKRICDMIISDVTNEKREKTILYMTGKSRCEKKIQDCPVTSLFSMSIHSTYDIPIRELVTALGRKKVLRHVGTFIFDPMMLLTERDNGYIEGVDCFWKIDRRVDIIRFDFNGDSSFSYEHKFSTYIQYITTRELVSDDGIFYSNQLLNNRAGVQKFELVQIDGNTTGKTPLTCTLFIPQLHDIIEVTYFRWNYNAKPELDGRNLPRLLRPVKYYIRKGVIDDVLTYVNNLQDNNFTQKNAINYLRSVSTRSVHNAKYVLSYEPMDASQLIDVGNAIYLMAYKMRWENGKVNMKLIGEMQRKRERGAWSWYKKLWNKIIGSVESWIDNEVLGEMPDEFLEVLFTKLVDMKPLTSPSVSYKTRAGGMIQASWLCEIPEGTSLITALKNEQTTLKLNFDEVKDTMSVEIKTDELMGGGIFSVDRVLSDDACHGDDEECLMTVHETISNPADGNCLYYSLLNTNDLEKVKQLKLELIDADKSAYSSEKQDQIIDCLTSESILPGLTIVDLFSTTKKINVHVHFKASESSCLLIKFNNRSFSKTIHLRHVRINDVGHYERLNTISSLMKDIDRIERVEKEYKPVEELRMEVRMQSDEEFSLVKENPSREVEKTTSFGGQPTADQNVSTTLFNAIKVFKRERNTIKPVGKLQEVYECSEGYFFFKTRADCDVDLQIKRFFGGSNLSVPFNSAFFLLRDILYISTLKTTMSIKRKVDVERLPIVILSNHLVSLDDKMRVIEVDNCRVATNLIMTCKIGNIEYSVDHIDFMSKKTIKSVGKRSRDTIIYLFDPLRKTETRPYNKFCKTIGRELKLISNMNFVDFDEEEIHLILHSKFCEMVRYKDFTNYICELAYGKPARIIRLYSTNKSDVVKIRKFFRDMNTMVEEIFDVLPIEKLVDLCNSDISKLTTAMNELAAADDTIYVNAKTSFKDGMEKSQELNNAGVKLKQIMSKYNIQSRKFLDLCSGPGGFTQYMTMMFGVTGYAHFYYSHDNKHQNPTNRILQNKRVNIISEKKMYGYTGDLTNEHERNYVIQYVDRCGIDFVMADGCSNNGADEATTDLLITAEINIVLNVLKTGGNAIIKMFVKDAILKQLCMLNGRFEKIVFEKPRNSNPLSSEIYVICLSKLVYQKNSQSLDYLGLLQITRKITNTIVSVLQTQDNGERKCDEQHTEEIETEDQESDDKSSDDPTPSTSKSKEVIPLKKTRSTIGPDLKRLCLEFKSNPTDENELKVLETLESDSELFTAEMEDIHRSSGIEGVVEELLKYSDKLQVIENDHLIVHTYGEKVYKLHSLHTLTSEELPNFSNLDNSKDLVKHWANQRVDNAYKPFFEKFDAKDEYLVARNAVREIQELWKVTETILKNTHRRYYMEFGLNSLGDKIMPSLVKKFGMEKLALGLIDMVTGKFVIDPGTQKTYSHAFDGKTFVKLSDDFRETKKLTASRYLLVSNFTDVMNERELYEATRSTNLYDFKMPKILNVGGVPGCGKTSTIAKKSKESHLIVTGTKEGKYEILRKFESLKLDTQKRKVRTVHSYLMHDFKGKYDVVWVDEALMRHYGEIILVVIRSSCKKLFMIGDNNQIGYFTRVPSVRLMYHNISNFVPIVTHYNVSHRVTGQAAHFLSKNYKNGFLTTNHVMNSISVVKYNSKQEIPLTENKDVQVLCFTKVDLHTLKTMKFKNVKTIGEYQGCQSKKIVLIRLNNVVVDQVFQDVNQIIVGLTRHTDELIYYTPIRDYLFNHFHPDGTNYCLRTNAELQDLVFRKGWSNDSSWIDTELNVKEELKGGKLVDFASELKETHTDTMDFQPTNMLRNLKEFPNIADAIDRSMGHAHAISSASRFIRPKVELDVVNNPAMLAPLDSDFLQIAYDSFLPGVSITNNEFDQMMVELAPLTMTHDSVVIDRSKKGPFPDQKPMLKPILRTAMPRLRETTQVDAMVGADKRNLNVHELDGIVDKEYFVKLAVDCFENTFIDPQYKDVYESFKDSPVVPNYNSVQQWMEDQPGSVTNQLTGENSVYDLNLSKYQLMNKRSVKPPLDVKSTTEYQAVQTIASQSKDHNMIFCPIFRDLKSRTLSVLRPNFMMFCDMSPDEFSKQFSSRFKKFLKKYAHKLEIDIGKYDKCQHELFLDIECEIFRRFGMSLEYIRLWRKAHKYTFLKDYNNGIEIDVMYQRKSGDASTYYGNTIVLMVVLSTIFDLRGCVGIFSGDDSVIFSDSDFDRNDVCADIFNLETKFYHWEYTHFCSKFLVFDGKEWMFVPDPLKVLTKLGRHDIVNWEHAEEYRISLNDLLDVYRNVNMHDYLRKAMAERYGCDFDVSLLLSTLMETIRTPSNFKKMFYVGEGDVLSKDPSRPLLD